MKNAEFERLKSDWLFAIDLYLDSDIGNDTVDVLLPEDKIVFLRLLEACMPVQPQILKNASQEIHGWKSIQIHEAWIMYQSQKDGEKTKSTALEKGFVLLQELAQVEAGKIVHNLKQAVGEEQREQTPTPVIAAQESCEDDEAGRPTLSCVDDPEARGRLERYIRRSAIGEASGLRFEGESHGQTGILAIPPGRPDSEVTVRIPKSDPPSFSPYKHDSSQRESYPEIKITFDKSAIDKD